MDTARKPETITKLQNRIEAKVQAALANVSAPKVDKPRQGRLVA